MKFTKAVFTTIFAAGTLAVFAAAPAPVKNVVRNPDFSKGIEKNGNPKMWGVDSKNTGSLVKLPNGKSAFKLTGSYLRQILFENLFMPTEDKTVILTVKVSGTGTLNVSNARFSQQKDAKGKTFNKFLKTVGIRTFAMTPAAKAQTAEFVIKKGEFCQLLFSAGNKSQCVIEEVSVTVKPAPAPAKK